MSRLVPTLAFGDIANSDLVIEAVFEDMDVKERVFRQLDEVARQGAILATNTSTLDVDRIAAFTRRPQDVLGAHSFSPANVMKLLEIVRGETTRDDVVTMMQIAKKIGKTAVVARVCDGFIGNRMLEQYIRQAMFLLEEGASPAQVDRALERFGMAMGPFRMKRSRRQRHRLAHPQAPLCRERRRSTCASPTACASSAASARRRGPGRTRYAAGVRDAIPDPAVDELIARYRREIGLEPREIKDDEIVDRCVLALVNEGARIVEEGIALRASDLDVVYLTGYGFPRYRGGPMFYADTLGLYRVVRRMHEISRRTRTPMHDSGNRRRWSRGGSQPRARPSTVDFPPRPLCPTPSSSPPPARGWPSPARRLQHDARGDDGRPRRSSRARSAQIDPAGIDDVVMGCAFPEGATGSNIARQIALRAGCPVSVPGMTVNRFCSSGLQTIAIAAQRIMAGEGSAFVAGGVEFISCVQNEGEPAHAARPAQQAQAGDLLADAGDSRVRRQALRDLARATGRVRRPQPAARRRGRSRRQVCGRDRADDDDDGRRGQGIRQALH